MDARPEDLSLRPALLATGLVGAVYVAAVVGKHFYAAFWSAKTWDDVGPVMAALAVPFATHFVLQFALLRSVVLRVQLLSVGVAAGPVAVMSAIQWLGVTGRWSQGMTQEIGVPIGDILGACLFLGVATGIAGFCAVWAIVLVSVDPGVRPAGVTVACVSVPTMAVSAIIAGRALLLGFNAPSGLDGVPGMLGLVVGVLAALPALRVACRMKRRAQGRACLRCGYDMNGLPSNVCPECGWSRAEE